jgi:hypothetical protein
MKNYIFIKKLFTILSATLLFYSCASSTGSRYEKDERGFSTDSSSANRDFSNVGNLSEDFDITPFKTQINIPETKTSRTESNGDIWYDYSIPVKETQTKKLMGTQDGYRVLVMSSDNLEEANQIKSEVYSRTDQNEVYIDFEPPFYKVKIGDFKDQKSADNMRFKLNQLGYKEAKVIKESINLFE